MSKLNFVAKDLYLPAILYKKRKDQILGISLLFLNCAFKGLINYLIEKICRKEKKRLIETLFLIRNLINSLLMELTNIVGVVK